MAKEYSGKALNKVEEVTHGTITNIYTSPNALPQRSLLDKVTSFDNIYGYTFYAVISMALLGGGTYMLYLQFTDAFNNGWTSVTGGIAAILPSLETLRGVASPITSTAAIINKYKNPLNWSS